MSQYFEVTETLLEPLWVECAGRLSHTLDLYETCSLYQFLSTMQRFGIGLTDRNSRDRLSSMLWKFQTNNGQEGNN